MRKNVPMLKTNTVVSSHEWPSCETTASCVRACVAWTGAQSPSVHGAIVADAPPPAWRSGESAELREESSFNCRAARKASDGFAQAGAPLWALLWKKYQIVQPQQDAVPCQAHGHGCQSAGGLPKPQGTFSFLCLCVQIILLKVCCCFPPLLNYLYVAFLLKCCSALVYLYPFIVYIEIYLTRSVLWCK